MSLAHAVLLASLIQVARPDLPAEECGRTALRSLRDPSQRAVMLRWAESSPLVPMPREMALAWRGIGILLARVQCEVAS